MIKLYTASDIIAERLARIKIDETAVLPMILKKQPPKGYIFHGVYNISVAFHSNTPATMDIWSTELQYPIGTKIGIRETWFESRPFIDTKSNGCCYMESKYIYKADEFSPEFDKWHSPCAMPHDAIRLWFTVTGNRVCQVQEITLGELDLLGLLESRCTKTSYKNKFIKFWNLQYAKLRPVRKHGEIVGYVCYPYSMESFYNRNNYPTDEPNWNKLPLTIRANPWLELIEIRRDEK